MSTTTSSSPSAVLDATGTAGTGAGAAVWSLAKLEAARNLRGAPLWIGLLGCALATRTMADEWQSGVYSLFPTWFIPLAIGIFVSGVRSGGRDRHVSAPPLAEEAALGPASRATARLLGLLPLVAIGAVLVAMVALGIRVEGGHWVGDEPGRTDEAVQTVPEILQPVVLLVLAAAAGVAAGRAVRRRTPVLVLGVVLWFLFGMVTWAWEAVPVRYVTPVQTQPIEQTIGSAGADPDAFPDHWLLSAPDEYDREWDRVIVHQPMAAWHDVYLVGLALAAAGFAVRGRGGRRALVAGVLVATLGVGAQAAVAPPSSAEVAGSTGDGP